jgi:hypothetical protein
MIVTRILRLLALVAVLVMPLGMATPAAARPITDMAMSHCPDQGSHHQQKRALVECTMACASALPAFDRTDDEIAPIARLEFVSLPAQPLHGLHPDTATPPPKAS